MKFLRTKPIASAFSTQGVQNVPRPSIGPSYCHSKVLLYLPLRSLTCSAVPCGTTSSTSPFGKRSDEHTSELQSLMRISYAVFCLKKNNNDIDKNGRQHLSALNT